MFIRTWRTRPELTWGWWYHDHSRQFILFSKDVGLLTCRQNSPLEAMSFIVKHICLTNSGKSGKQNKQTLSKPKTSSNLRIFFTSLPSTAKARTQGYPARQRIPNPSLLSSLLRELMQHHLVGGWANLKNMKVNWDDEIPNIWENRKCQPNHQPVIFTKTFGAEKWPKAPIKQTTANRTTFLAMILKWLLHYTALLTQLTPKGSTGEGYRWMDLSTNGPLGGSECLTIISDMSESNPSSKNPGKCLTPFHWMCFKHFVDSVTLVENH